VSPLPSLPAENGERRDPLVSLQQRETLTEIYRETTWLLSHFLLLSQKRHQTASLSASFSRLPFHFPLQTPLHPGLPSLIGRFKMRISFSAMLPPPSQTTPLSDRFYLIAPNSEAFAK
jgi:hypothetical protein